MASIRQLNAASGAIRGAGATTYAKGYDTPDGEFTHFNIPGLTGPVATSTNGNTGGAGYEGIAAPQVINGGAGQLIGGGNQVYIPKVNAGWFK